MVTLFLITPVLAYAADNTWTGSGPFATGLGNRVINAIAIDPTNPNIIYAGTGSGTVFMYTAVKPSVTTTDATGVGTDSATLNATVNAHNAETTITFEYGSDSHYGTSVSAIPDKDSGASDISVSYSLNSLTPGQTYHYRVVAVNSAGATNGADAVFTTQKLAATVILGNLAQTYDGSPRNASATTNPPGLTVTLTYDGSSTPPTNAGSYTVVGTIVDATYQGSQTGTLVITQAVLTIIWSNPANITYGTALGNAQLNATVNCGGSFIYTPGLGTVLNAGNGQTLHAAFTPTDTLNYSVASKDVVINVLKANQTITFNALPAKTTADADFGPGATASSGLPVSYSSSNTAVATIVSGKIHIVGPGTSTITASQGGDTNYNAAPEVQQTLTVTHSVTVFAATGNGQITLTTNNPFCVFSDVQTKTKEQVPVADSSYSYPYGLVEFRLNCSSPGISADVMITFPGDVTGTTYRKYGPTPPDFNNPQWYTFNYAEISGNTVTLHLKDGEVGDDTGLDGIIVDQGGPGQPGNGGTVSIPTINEWGMIIFMALAGLVSIYSLRRRRM
jgi:hypothetical protein